MLSFAFAVFCALAWCSQAQAQPSPARRAFAGRVTTDNGLPVGGAAITVRRQGAVSAAFWGTVLYSDARGDFSFPDAEDGDYNVTIEAGGMTSFGSNYALGEKTSFLKATLDRLATLSLRVLRPDGTPLASTPVWVLMHESTHGTNSARRGATDAQGVVAFPDAAPGVVSARVTAQSLGYVDVNDIKLAPASHPAAVDARLQAGGKLRIAARDSIASDAAKTETKRVLGGVMVTLSIDSTDASRFQGAAVSSVYENTGGNLLTRDDGATEISALAPGIYYVSLYRNNYSAPTAQNIVVKANETASLDFEMKRGEGVSVAPLALVAQNAKGEVLANRSLYIVAEMLAANGDNVLVSTVRNARSDGAGRVVLYPLEVGRWRITPRIAANSDALADANSPAAAPQTATIATLAAAGEPVTLKFSFAAP